MHALQLVAKAAAQPPPPMPRACPRDASAICMHPHVRCLTRPSRPVPRRPAPVVFPGRLPIPTLRRDEARRRILRAGGSLSRAHGQPPPRRHWISLGCRSSFAIENSPLCRSFLYSFCFFSVLAKLSMHFKPCFVDSVTAIDGYIPLRLCYC